MNGLGRNKQSINDFAISQTNTNSNFVSFAIDVHHCLFSAFLQHWHVIYTCTFHQVCMMCYFCPLHTRQHTSIRNMITVSTGPNLTESGPKLDLVFVFRVWSESARADPDGPRPDAKQTSSRPRLDAKQTWKANPNFRSEPIKRTRGPLYVTELSIKIYIKMNILLTLETTMFQCPCFLKKISF